METEDESSKSQIIIDFDKRFNGSFIYEEDRIAINWNAFKIYSSIGDDLRSKTTLQSAYNEIMKRASLFELEENRQSYIENIRMNRDIINTWGKLNSQEDPS